MQISEDVIDPARAEAMMATLGQPRGFAAGEALPPFFHQLYFWEPKPPGALGRDGHPKLGGLIPDMGLPRRMWAGGRLEFETPLRAGQPAQRRSVCETAKRKTGRSGALGIVTLRHEIWQDGRRCLTDWQDLVYREDPDPAAPGPTAPVARTDEALSEARSFDATLLFRYSALTFNGHRIHYDRDYAREFEGYTGLVVHGPLLAQHLMLMAEARLGGLSRFSFRATSPLMDFETAEFCWKDGAGWVRGPDGRQCMVAEAG
ncbi:FAS1-like dehydratase domain-containing protein [Roseovarius faecimaris]|nr:MaoC family dehydratase N-terminal domain-containing protein [Roseovarius faecimaris]